MRLPQRALAQALRQAHHQARLLYTDSSSLGAALDRITLRGLVFHGHHGVLKEERVLGQKFVVDVDLDADLSTAGRTDDIKDTIDYAAVYSEVKDVMHGPPKQLLESVAHDIATRLLAQHDALAGVRISIQKPHVAVSGVLESLGVEISRSRKQGGSRQLAAPHSPAG